MLLNISLQKISVRINSIRPKDIFFPIGNINVKDFSLIIIMIEMVLTSVIIVQLMKAKFKVCVDKESGAAWHSG